MSERTIREHDERRGPVKKGLGINVQGAVKFMLDQPEVKAAASESQAEALAAAQEEAEVIDMTGPEGTVERLPELQEEQSAVSQTDRPAELHEERLSAFEAHREAELQAGQGASSDVGGAARDVWIAEATATGHAVMAGIAAPSTAAACSTAEPMLQPDAAVDTTDLAMDVAAATDVDAATDADAETDVDAATDARRVGLRAQTMAVRDKRNLAAKNAREQASLPVREETKVLDVGGYMPLWEKYNFGSWPAFDILDEMTCDKAYDKAVVQGTAVGVNTWRSQVAQYDISSEWGWLDVMVRLQVGPYDPFVGQLLKVTEQSSTSVQQLREAEASSSWKDQLKLECLLAGFAMPKSLKRLRAKDSTWDHVTERLGVDIATLQAATLRALGHRFSHPALPLQALPVVSTSAVMPWQGDGDTGSGFHHEPAPSMPKWKQGQFAEVLRARDFSEVGKIRQLIRLSGAAGPFAPAINGVYEATGEEYNGKMLFQQIENSAIWLRFTKDGMWIVSDTASKDANNTQGICHSEVQSSTLDHPAAVGTRWSVCQGFGNGGLAVWRSSKEPRGWRDGRYLGDMLAEAVAHMHLCNYCSGDAVASKSTCKRCMGVFPLGALLLKGVPSQGLGRAQEDMQ